MGTTMEKSEIIRNFSGYIHCSQVVVKQWAEELGLDEETMVRMAAPFAGGCMEGNVCGCVCGALMLLGAEYGYCELGDAQGSARLAEKCREFKEKFADKYGSLICRDLTGFDFSKEGELERARESGVMMQRCPDYVNYTLELLDEMLG